MEQSRIAVRESGAVAEPVRTEVKKPIFPNFFERVWGGPTAEEIKKKTGRNADPVRSPSVTAGSANQEVRKATSRKGRNMTTPDIRTHVLRLHSLLEDARHECEGYDEPLQIQLKIGGKTFMEMSKASLSSANLFSTIDYKAFEEAVKSNPSLEVVVFQLDSDFTTNPL
jgi:hypothetical protein